MTKQDDNHKQITHVEHVNNSMKHFELSIPIQCTVKMKFSTFEDSLKLMNSEEMKLKIAQSEEFFKFPHEIYVEHIDLEEVICKEVEGRSGLIFSFFPRELSFVEVKKNELIDKDNLQFNLHRGNPYYR